MRRRSAYLGAILLLALGLGSCVADNARRFGPPSVPSGLPTAMQAVATLVDRAQWGATLTSLGAVAFFILSRFIPGIPNGRVTTSLAAVAAVLWALYAGVCALGATIPWLSGAALVAGVGYVVWLAIRYAKEHHGTLLHPTEVRRRRPRSR